MGFAASSDRAVYKVEYFNSTVVQTAGEPDLLRLEIGINKPSEAFRVSENPANAKELIVDLDKMRLSKVKKSIQLDGKMADKIQFLKRDKENSYAVITLAEDLRRNNYKVYTLPKDAAARKPFRIVIDIIDRGASQFTAGIAGKKILLDAGHGGSDTGAIGPSGVREKDVTLDVTLKVEALLRQAGAAVIMTRKDDRDVYGAHATDLQELQARVDVGRRSRADIFLSIHANSFSRASAHGTSTYYYEKTPLDKVLAQALQDGMVEYGGRYDRGIAKANFYVVKRSDMPAALVELAFVSNYEEERLLNSPEYRKALAEGICKGLSSFFAQAEGLER